MCSADCQTKIHSIRAVEPSHARSTHSGGGTASAASLAFDDVPDLCAQVHSIKQIIGRQFDDRMVSDVLQHKSWAFSVVKGPGGGCRIQGAPAETPLQQLLNVCFCLIQKGALERRQRSSCTVPATTTF